MLKKPGRLFSASFLAVAGLALLAILSARNLNSSAFAASLNHTQNSSHSHKNAANPPPFTFALVPGAGISACLPHATGSITITPGTLNDLMQVTVKNLAPNDVYDLFVIQVPTAPFGISWYQTDVDTDLHGNGTATARGIFDGGTTGVDGTFSLSPPNSPTVTFAPTSQFHIGIWFDDPKVPFNIGCEPGQPKPIVTPFNSQRHAGIQVLNTSEFPNNAGPLSKVK